ncbi:MAG: MmgE/PrpD family protein [Lautropia sp.]
MTEPLGLPFARYAANAAKHDFPPEARRLAVDSITDCLGCLFAGSVEPAAAKIRALIPLSERATSALDTPCPTTDGFTTAADAAFFGGTVTDILDFDDVSHPGHAHPSTVMVPALLALAPHTQATGTDLVNAFLCGFELMGKLGRALNPTTFEFGWHPTPTLGPLMSALAAGALLRLDERRILTALGIAASAAAGVRANFGTMVKPLHAGQAARAGVVAALLAREGFTASDEALEHRFGYLHCFSGGGSPDLAPLRRPGEDLEILSIYGHALKPYPACAATHPGIEAAIGVHRQLAGRAIERVRVGTAALTFKPLIHDRPTTGLEGKFSLQFCVAAGLLDGRVEIGTFTPDRVLAPDVRTLLDRMSVEVDEEFRDSHEYATAVTVETPTGERLEARIPLARGKPGRRFSESDVHDKFFGCTRAALSPAQARRLYETVRAIDGDSPASQLSRALQPGNLVPQAA